MCTMTAMVVTTLATTALSMAGQYQQQRTQEKTAKASAAYNMQVAENEAAMQQQLARNEISRGVADSERQQRQAARAMGEMRAGMGASGFEMDTGAMVSLLGESATEHQYDANITRQNSEQAAWQHMVGVTAANNNAALANYQRRNATSGRAGAYLGMGGTLLGGIGSAIGGVNSWQQTTTPAATGGQYWDRALGQYVYSPVRH